MVDTVSRIQRMFLLEPYLWLQCCFFQPMRFKNTFEAKGLSQRLLMMLRLTPLLFLYSYTPALIIRIIIYVLRPDLWWVLFDAAWATALSCLIAAMFGGLFNTRLGIAVALALGLASGIIVHTASDPFTGIIFGIAFGIALGVAFNSAHALKEGGLERVTIASALGIISGVALGFLAAILGGFWAAFALGAVDPAVEDENIIAGSIAGLIAGGIFACLLAAILGFIVRKVVRDREQVAS